MSEQIPERFRNANVVDLSNQAPGGPGEPGSGPQVEIAVTEANFQQVMELSLQVPIVVDLWAEWCEPCKQLTPVLRKLAREFNGSILLATIDTESEPQAAAPFQVQSLPTVMGVIKGQVVPLFTGAVPEADARQVFEQLLKIAAENGVTGKLPGGGEPAPPPEPPLHTEGFDAMERGDLPAAKAAFTKQINEAPADDVAKAALAQIALMERTEGADLRAAIEAAASGGLAEHLAAADADMALGNPDAAFSRLLAVIRKTAGDERDTARMRLLDYFLILGPNDDRVVKARRELAAALF